MVPTEVIVVDQVPVLGSGKVDNVAVAGLVRDRAAGGTGEDSRDDAMRRESGSLAAPRAAALG